MKNFTAIVQELPKSDIQNAVVQVKISGQPIREFSSPAIVTSIKDGLAISTCIGAGPKEIIDAIESMINIFYSRANELEMLVLGNVLCSKLEEIANETQKSTGGVC